MRNIRPRTGEEIDQSIRATLRDKYADILLPGYQVEFDPDEAELAGAFDEDALSEEEALDSVIDAPAVAAAASTSTEAP